MKATRAEDGQWFEFVFEEVNMIGNAIELSKFLKRLSFGFRTWLIEEIGTFLIQRTVKTAPLLICLMDNDLYDIRIKLQHQTIPSSVLTATYLFCRFLLFEGPAHKTDMWVFIIKQIGFIPLEIRFQKADSMSRLLAEI